jgi:hypothetical protein
MEMIANNFQHFSARVILNNYNVNLGTRALCRQTECRQTECCQTECCQTECRQTECRQTECRQTECCFYNIRPNVARLNVAAECCPNEIGLTTPNLT